MHYTFLEIIGIMKNSLKLSRYNAQYHHDYQDAIFNDYPGKKKSISNSSYLFFLNFLLETKFPSTCAGCHCQIYDQYLLKVAPDLEWHIQCLKCSECGLYLDETTTCFVFDGKTFCKYDYIRYVSIDISFYRQKKFDLEKLSQMIIISAVKKN
jgi:hypothetical protein